MQHQLNQYDTIIRVYYEHQTDKNTFVDFFLLPNQQKVLRVEIRRIIPEHTKLVQDVTPQTLQEKGN